MNRTGIYGQAIKRTFADLYGVSPDAVDVSWTTGKTIVVHCAGKTFLHPILSDPDDDAPVFTCLEEDPVIVNLTDDERRGLELSDFPGLAGGRGTVLHKSPVRYALLGWSKIAARRIESPSLRADAMEAVACGWLLLVIVVPRGAMAPHRLPSLDHLEGKEDQASIGEIAKKRNERSPSREIAAHNQRNVHPFHK